MPDGNFLYEVHYVKCHRKQEILYIAAGDKGQVLDRLGMGLRNIAEFALSNSLLVAFLRHEKT